MNSARIVKSIAIVCFVLLTVAIIVAVNHPARGYEMSIYRATPMVVWAAIILSIISGLGIVLHQIYRQREKRSRLWVIGLLLLVSGFIILLSVHVFRGYLYMGRADSTSHLATVRDLLNNGHITRQNFYPLTHIYIAQLSLVWDASLARLFSVLPALFNTLYIIFVYLFARTVLNMNGQVILTTIVGIFLLSSVGTGSVYTAPNDLADLMMPLVFMLCLRRLSGDDPFRVQITILFLIMVFLIPPFHVVSAFALFLVLTSLWLPMKAYNWVAGNRKRTLAEYRFVVPAMVILFVWGISWISSFYVWESVVKNVYLVFTQGGPTWASQLEDQMLLATQYGYSWMEQFFKAYYGLLVYAILTLVSFPMMIKSLSRDHGLEKLLSLYGPLLAFVLFLTVFYALNIGFSPARLTKYEAMLSVPLVGYAIYELVRSSLKRKLWAKAGLAITVTALVLMVVNGVFIAYFSPYHLLPSDQPTLAEPDGLEWLNVYRGTSLGLVTLTLPLDRMTALLPATQWDTRDVSRVPYHFNYPERNALGESYTRDGYLALTTVDRVFYVDLFPGMAPYRFYPGDFVRLESDPSLDKVYFNRGMEVWYIHARK